MNEGQLVVNYIIVLTLGATVLFMGIESNTRHPRKCHTIDYIQRGRWQSLEVCVGDSVEINDTGLASQDSVFFQENVQPVIDSLKQTRK